MLHSRELVENLFLTDTKAAMSLSLTLFVIALNRDVKAALVEITGRFIVVKADIHLRHTLVSFETLTRCLFTPVHLSVL